MSLSFWFWFYFVFVAFIQVKSYAFAYTINILYKFEHQFPYIHSNYMHLLDFVFCLAEIHTTNYLCFIQNSFFLNHFLLHALMHWNTVTCSTGMKYSSMNIQREVHVSTMFWIQNTIKSKFIRKFRLILIEMGKGNFTLLAVTWSCAFTLIH